MCALGPIARQHQVPGGGSYSLEVCDARFMQST
jgi:hypothetical protein